MTFSLRIIAISTFVTALLFANVIAEIESIEESRQLKSLRNSTMAERLDEGIEVKHEIAVDDPEAVAAMVDITNDFRMDYSEQHREKEARILLMRDRKPHRRLLAVRPQLDPQPPPPRRLLHRPAATSGGRDGRFYVVTDPSDDDPVNPRPGTLRHAVIQDRPLWIIFKRDMVITLKQELIMNSFKTIDGRGVNVHIANGACITIQFVTNIIIHGLHIHDCKRTGNAMVRSSPSHYGWRTMADGDGISIFGSSHVWIDHNSLSSCSDGLIDAIMGSTAITISNNYFTQHNEVMLLGHSDSYTRDKVMQVTVAYNHFGEGLTQRMPRCRHGYFHVVNNDYTSWEMYAIGGSANPTINSQGNRFLAPTNRFAKEVTKRIVNPDDNKWKEWNWRSEGDLLLNGAYFTPSGGGASASYARASSLAAKSSSMVPTLTSEAGVLHCRKGVQC
ncbi:hypothetical protein DH2020_024691 [Rehmannia glutinosa]|uniref:Pectate lyase n=1 Tax=Rehmannia glutinosa TaxID=99300 RepID=A0ABR0W660_REHGL